MYVGLSTVCSWNESEVTTQEVVKGENSKVNSVRLQKVHSPKRPFVSEDDDLIHSRYTGEAYQEMDTHITLFFNIHNITDYLSHERVKHSLLHGFVILLSKRFERFQEWEVRKTTELCVEHMFFPKTTHFPLLQLLRVDRKSILVRRFTGPLCPGLS